MIRPARDEWSPAVTAGTAFPFVPVVGKHTCPAAGDDCLLGIDDGNLFTGKAALCDKACKAPEKQSVTIDYCNHV
jgi:hypothetical protein